MVAADGILIFIQLSTIQQLKGVTSIQKHNVQTKLNDTEIKGIKLKINAEIYLVFYYIQNVLLAKYK